jgi:hypothetical protein
LFLFFFLLSFFSSFSFFLSVCRHCFSWFLLFIYVLLFLLIVLLLAWNPWPSLEHGAKQAQNYTTVDPKQWVDSRSVLRNRLKSMRNIEKPPRTPIRP